MSGFSEPLKKKIEGFLGRYETKRSAILPVLHAIQDEHGWISDEQVESLHNDFGLERVHVREVITFYTLYHDTPPAKYEILFCDNIVCSMMGAKDAMNKIEQRIEKIKGSGKECPFSLEGVPCLGVCDGAPAMLVNKDRYLKVGSSEVDKILDDYEAKA